MWDNRNDNGKTHGTASAKRHASHGAGEAKNQEASIFVLVIGPQSPHSLQHLGMLAALYGWDLLVMAEHGRSVVTSETTMQQSTLDLLRILEGR